MTLFCQRCGEKFDSLIIDQNIAMREVTERIVKHCIAKHHEAFKLLQEGIVKVSLAAGGFLTLTELARVPEDEKFVIDKLSECQDILMAAVGFDAETTGEETNAKN